MDRRIQLHADLVEMLGSTNVYYQPPENIRIQYPCIVYGLSRINTSHANNKRYKIKNRYTVTIIDKKPDSKIYTEMLNYMYAGFDRVYTKEGLNHFVFTVHY